MAAPAEAAEHQPTAPCVLLTTAQSTASSSNFSLASQDPMLMPTPRLVSCPHQAGSAAVVSAVDTDSGSLPGPSHDSGEVSGDQDATQQQPAVAADINSSPVVLSIFSSMDEDGRLDELRAACKDEGSMPEAGWQDSGPAILVTNELFQQLPVAAQQSDQWQANDIFETQTSMGESNGAGKGMSAPSDQYSSLVISSSSRSEHSSCWLAESAYSMQSGTLEQAEEHHGLDDVHQSSRMTPGSASQQLNSQQQQAFSVLFDTQLSQILTTQGDLFGSSAELPAHNGPEAASAQCDIGGPTQQAQQAVSPCSSHLSDVEPSAEPVTVCRSSSAINSASDSTLISVHSAMSGEACVASAQQVLTTAAVADTTGGSRDTAAVESSAAAPPCINHQEVVEREPLTAAVSTAQLEVMGWDMFADTLGTFRLLSDTDSDAGSTVTLPEPCELGPVTPEVAEHQLKLNQGQYTEDAPAMLCLTGTDACLDACKSQGRTQLELTGSTFSVVPTDRSVIVNHVSCLEQEYETMLADRQCLVEGYPGMSSDAEEFDGPGTGCLGQYTSCATGVEQCVTCNPCATCACYPYAALRPGKRHQKSRFKRVWARLRRTSAAAACLRPKFEHERYS